MSGRLLEDALGLHSRGTGVGRCGAVSLLGKDEFVPIPWVRPGPDSSKFVDVWWSVCCFAGLGGCCQARWKVGLVVPAPGAKVDAQANRAI